MPTKGEEVAQLLDALDGMVTQVLARADELGVEVTAQQLATNVVPQLGRLAGDMLAHAKEHGSFDGARLEFVPATAQIEQTDTDEDIDGM